MLPPARVREVLEASRQAGQPFPDAWQAAMAVVRGRERDAWLSALRSTADAWARAYAGSPLTPPERALAFAGTDLEPLSAMRCVWCRKPIDATGRGQARRRFCCDDHRRQYHYANGSG